MAASRLQTEPASRARLEDELLKLSPQQLAAGCALGDRQGAAPHGRAEPLDQPRLADDQAVSLSRTGERAIAADRQTPTCGGVFGSSSAAASPRPP